MCVNIKNIWNDNYYKYTLHRWVSLLKEDETGVGFGVFFFCRHIPVEQRKYDFFQKSKDGKNI